MGKAHTEMSGVQIHLPPEGLLADGSNFFEFCQINRDYRIERSAKGDVWIMPPTGGETGYRNSELAIELGMWARGDKSGVVFDSSTGFILPNGATRSPDAAWVKRSRLAQLSAKQKQRFLPLAPDFVIELLSLSDRLSDAQDKMQEYLDNGVRLGWLIEPDERRVWIYRPDAPVACLENPAQMDATPVLTGFVLPLQTVWEIDF